jgi:hypothetical protein
MKVGIIIVFDASHDAILHTNIIDTLNGLPDINFCLVNNNCPEILSDILLDISYECKNATVIHIKKSKGNPQAIRAGIRYMNNHFNLKFLGYVCDLDINKIVEAVELFAKHYEDNQLQELNNQSKKLLKQAFLKKIFSVSNYYKQINYKFDIK